MPRHPYRMWTGIELRWFADNYYKLSNIELAKHLDRPLRSIVQKSRELGLRKVEGRFRVYSSKNDILQIPVDIFRQFRSYCLLNVEDGKIYEIGIVTGNTAAEFAEKIYNVKRFGEILKRDSSTRSRYRKGRDHIMYWLNQAGVVFSKEPARIFAEIKTAEIFPAGFRKPDKLSKEDRQKIRELYTCEEWTQTDLAKFFGVNQSQISRVIRGRGPR